MTPAPTTVSDLPADGQPSSWGDRLTRQERAQILVIVALHLAVVVPLAAVLNIWIDEAYTLQSTGGGIGRAIERAIRFELQPPLYFVGLTLWRTMGESLFFARLLSVLCTTAAVWTTGTIAKRFAPTVSPALVAAVVAFNPLTVYAAVDARPYALVLLLCALLIRCFYDGFLASTNSGLFGTTYTVLGIAGLYTNYFTGFLLAAGAVAILVTPRRSALPGYIVRMAIVGIAFAPLAMLTSQQVAAIHAVGSAQWTLFESARHVWWVAWRQILPAGPEGILADARRWTAMVAIPLVLVGIALRRDRVSTSAGAAIALALVVAAFHVSVVSQLGGDFLQSRHAVVLYLPVVVAAVAATEAIAGSTAARAIGVASIAFSALTLVETYSSLEKTGDWVRVSRYIEQHESTAEPIVVFRGEYVLALRHHYRGTNTLIPLPRLMEEGRYDPRSQSLGSRSEIDTLLGEATQSGRRFWLVTYHTAPFRGVDVHPEILEGYVAECCITLRDVHLHETRVRQLEFVTAKSNALP